MGAEQSTPNAGRPGAGGVVRRTCYYEVLGVQRQATDDEIRKAYKKKALELHPDRNLNDTETATKKFAEVQTAYEILSDSQERAWYDAHRDAILNGDSDPSSSGGGRPDEHAGYNISAQAIFSLMQSFNSSTPMTDETGTGFFGVLNNFFDQLVAEEIAACEWEGGKVTFYPAFGKAGDDHNTVVRPFYNAWAAFSTRKSFSWLDKYRTSEAPDRRVRRLMEKENKKCRDEGIREFNDAVLSLVAFVKRRDPRYIPSTQSEAERQNLLRHSAAAQAARSRAANQQKLGEFVIPEWAQSADTNTHEEEFSISEEESEVEHIECVVCCKIFKSENQFQAHEKSKKHLKAAQQLRRQMKKENAEINAATAVASPTDTPAVSDTLVDDSDAQAAPPKADEPDITKDSAVAGPEAPASDHESPSTSSDNDEYAPRSEVEGRFSRTGPAEQPVAGDQDIAEIESLSPMVEDMGLNDQAPPKTLGKAKQKKAKRLARQAAEGQDQAQPQCAVCAAQFASRTQLFAHLRQEGHATGVAQDSNRRKTPRR